jgi:AraC-like DNA-binding protein
LQIFYDIDIRLQNKREFGATMHSKTLLFGKNIAASLQKAQHSLRSGLEITFVEGELEAPLTVPFTVDKAHTELCFFLSGRIEVRANNLNVNIPDNLSGYVLLSSLQKTEGTVRISDEVPLKVLCIQALPHTLPDCFGAGDKSAPTLCCMKSSPAMDIIVRKMCRHRSAVCSSGSREPGNSMVDMLLESMTLELLHAWMKVTEGKDESISAEDKKRLHEARRILDTDLAEPPGLTDLARRCGLNEHKLKKGFKALFSTTVYGYVTEQRMETAREHLSSGHMNVNEAGWAVGYSNVSHFIAAFRRQFGISPGSYMREARRTGMAV